MIDLPFELPERTRTLDSLYAALGRALIVASAFESNCKTLAFGLGIRSQANLLQDSAAFDAIVEKTSKASLNAAINNIDKSIGDTRGILERGRIARNALAHDSCFIFNGHVTGGEIGRNFEAWLGNPVEDIVIANYTVLLLMGVLKLLEAGLPNWSIVQSYPKELTEWILLDEKERSDRQPTR